MKKSIVLSFLITVLFVGITSASFITKQREFIDYSPRLEVSSGVYFVFDKSPLGDSDRIEYHSQLTGEDMTKEYLLPYNTLNFKSVQNYVAVINSGTISDGPYLRTVSFIDAFFQNKYLYIGTTNNCNVQSYMLNTTTSKRKKYPNLTKMVYTDRYFIGDENYGCDDDIKITVSNPQNLFDIKRASFNKTYMSGYDVKDFAMSGDTTLLINFDRFSRLTGDVPKTLQRSLDLSTIDRKNKKQKYFYQE